ncbi:MAG: DMT family transporter [Planctomycetes bacterium]|nr:DMT family transporter [Planctomycetota bacterium]
MAYFHFIACVLIWSTSFVLMKKAVLVFEPLSVAAWRVVLGAAVVLTAWWWQSGRWTVDRRNLAPVLLVIVLGSAWPFAIQPYLVGRVGSGLLGMSVGLVPLVTLVISIPILDSLPTRLQILGVLGALAALAMLLFDRLRLDVAAVDLLLVTSVPIGYATANVVVRRWLCSIPALELTACCLSGAGLMLAPTWLRSPPAPSDTNGSWLQASLCVALLGIVGTGLAQVFFNRMIQERGPLFASMANNLVPVGAVLIAWWDMERVTGLQLIALLIVVAMVALVQWEDRRQRRRSMVPRTSD